LRSNAHFRQLAEHVKRGVWEAGGFPLEFPVFSTGESLLRPTAMLYRNLLAMDTEESLRANPLDGVILLAGCGALFYRYLLSGPQLNLFIFDSTDKTTPGPLMGAASVGLPTLLVSGGPMLNGKFCGKDVGSGTDVWKFSEDVRAGKMSLEAFFSAESGMSRSSGYGATLNCAYMLLWSFVITTTTAVY